MYFLHLFLSVCDEDKTLVVMEQSCQIQRRKEGRKKGRKEELTLFERTSVRSRNFRQRREREKTLEVMQVAVIDKSERKGREKSIRRSSQICLSRAAGQTFHRSPTHNWKTFLHWENFSLFVPGTHVERDRRKGEWVCEKGFQRHTCWEVTSSLCFTTIGGALS